MFDSIALTSQVTFGSLVLLLDYFTIRSLDLTIHFEDFNYTLSRGFIVKIEDGLSVSCSDQEGMEKERYADFFLHIYYLQCLLPVLTFETC
jgi:hypothetical protein